jgi:hypothetical protein
MHKGNLAAGIAYSHEVPQPEMAKSYYKSDHQRYQAAVHAAHCITENCEWCRSLCDQGLIISCDQCGHVHHTDWLGWQGTLDNEGRCTVLCPECRTKDKVNLTVK